MKFIGTLLKVVLIGFALVFGIGFAVSLLHSGGSLLVPASQSIATSAHSGCTAADFAINKLNATSAGYGYVNVNGVLTNNCSMAAGAQLKIVYYDKNGGIISSSEPWPASIRNIPAHSDYVFKLMGDPRETQGMKRYTVEVIDARVW